MNIHRIEVENFLSHIDSILRISNQGVTLVMGKVEDSSMSNSNGAGKSSILPEALLFGLFGKTLRGSSGSKVVNRNVGKNCLVTIVGDVDGIPFTIRRPVKHQDYQYPEIEYNGVLYQGAEKVKEIVNIQILGGIGFDTFTAALIFGKGKNSLFFSQLDDASRKNILEEIQGLTILSRAEIYAKDKLRGFESDIRAFKTNLATTDAILASMRDESAELKKRSIDYENERSTKIADLEEKLAGLIRQQRSLEKLVEEGKVLSEELKIESGKVEAAIILKEGSHKHLYGNRQDIYFAQVNTDSEIQAIVEKLVSFSHLQRAGICDKCNSKLESGVLQHNIDDIRKEENERRKYKVKLNGVYSQLTKELDKIDKSLQGLRSRQSELRDATLRVDLQTKTAGEDHTNLVRNRNTLTKELKATQETKNGFQELFEKARQKIDSLEAEKSKLLVAIKDSTSFFDAWTAIANLYGNKGLKSFLMEGVLPTLNEALDKYSEILTTGELTVRYRAQTELTSGDKREKISLAVFHGGNEFTYDECSEGQKRRVDILTTLALGDLAAKRIGQRINFAVLDEIFDGLDDTGLDSVTHLLKDMIRDRENVFVITHDDKLANYFSNIVMITNREGNSYLQAA